MKKVLIINPFGIGDVLFTTPLAREIKRQYPDCSLGYWCNERVQDILITNPHIDKVFGLSRGDVKRIAQDSKLESARRFLGLLSALKKAKFEVALDFSLDHRYGLIAKLLGIKKRIGFNYKNRGRFLTDKINIEGYCDKHVSEYYLDLLNFLGIIPKSRNLELFIPDEEKLKAQRLLVNLGIQDNDLVIGIAVGGGASWGRDAARKHWPAQNFAQLANRLIRDLRAKVVVLGDGQEKPIAARVMEITDNQAIDLTGSTSLEESAAVIDRLNLLIANDGGLLHMAVSLGKKSVSFFGPVDPRVYGPYPPDEKRHIVLQHVMDCSPCYLNFRLALCYKDLECLKDIGIEEALTAAKRLCRDAFHSNRDSVF